MTIKPIEPLAPELEAAIRARLNANPFIKFVGIQVPQLGKGYARFVLPFKRSWPTPSASCKAA